jgi:hypothetical protein
LAAVASRQYGCFRHRQAVEAGFADSTIDRRISTGTWEVVEPFVYRAALATPIQPIDRLAARCLARDGVAAYQSAAALYGITAHPPEPQVLVPHGRHNKGDFSTRFLPSYDIATVARLKATTPARTLVDLCRFRTDTEATQLVESALVKNIVTVDRLERRARELLAPRREGCRRVLRVLGTLHPEFAHTRNEWEALMLRLVVDAGLPTPIANYEVLVEGQRFVLDLAWPAWLVLAEFDGRDPHARRRVFDGDRERQNALVAAGWLPFRFTSTALVRTPARSIGRLAKALEQRRQAA